MRFLRTRLVLFAARSALAMLAAHGCSFSGSSGSPDAGDGDFDAPLDEGPVDFLPIAARPSTGADWTIDTNTRINTTTGDITPAPPGSVTFELEEQQDGSAEAAVVRVRDLQITAGVTLSATGSRPLFLLAERDAFIDGTLDVGGHAHLAGPGGTAGGTGPGAGKASVHEGQSNDSGGGGGSFGTVGAAGGTAGMARSAPGSTYVISGNLRGGSSGGRATSGCLNPAGGGGGALLLYARRQIRVDGAINASGGGGAGGLEGSCAPGAGPGAGGGSGGVIWLQSAKVGGSGVLAANGGGGGGGSYPVGDGTTHAGDGKPGQDGKASTSDVAAGGAAAPNVGATAGGSGAIQGTPPSIVPTIAFGNGGGGGGGLGRIVYRAPDLGSLRSSPIAVPAPTPR